MRHACTPVLLTILAAFIINLEHQSQALEARLQWATQLGSSEPDGYPDVALDGDGNLFIAGSTSGSLDGNDPNLYGDIFLAMYDAGGRLQWVRQEHSLPFQLLHVAANLDGSAYIAGTTYEPGASNQGFVSKYNTSGVQQWSLQIGTPKQDDLLDIAADGMGNVYVTGFTLGSFVDPTASAYNAFVSKIGHDGSIEWTSEFGGDRQTVSKNVVADALGNVFLSGYVKGEIEEPNEENFDAFVTKYSADGVLQWSRQIGSAGTENSEALAIDGLGSVYVGGSTDCSVSGTDSCQGGAFVAKYNSDGDSIWLRQFPEAGFAHAMAADVNQNVYFAGFDPAFPGAMFSKLDASGNLVWQFPIGAEPDDGVTGVAGATIDDLGNIFISGNTSGNIAAPNAGYADAYLLKIRETPEPGALALLATSIILIGLSTSRWLRR